MPAQTPYPVSPGRLFSFAWRKPKVAPFMFQPKTHPKPESVFRYLPRNMKQIVATSLRQSLCVLHNVHDFLHKQPMSEGSPGTQRGSD